MYSTLEKIKSLLKDKFQGTIKDFYIDDPNLIPLDNLPCIAIVPVSTDINIADTGRDQFTFTINVFLIISAKQELDKYKGEMVGTQFLTKTMEEKDDSGNLKDSTILYVLRKNLELGTNWSILNVSRIEYLTRARPEQAITKEASCRITVSRINVRP